MEKSECKISFLVIGLLSILVTQSISAQSTSAQSISNNKEFEYHVVSPTAVNHLSAGKILGVNNSDLEARIVSSQIIKGNLPEGIAMFDDGTLAVTQDSEQIKPGKYKIKAEFVDVNGKSFTEKVKFEILKPVDYVDVEGSIHIAKPKFTSAKLTNHYKVGDIIAQFYDPNGAIKEAKLIKGSIPAGVMFVQNKNFIVTQPDQLKDGEYFCLFLLIDEKGGNSVLAVSLPIGLQVGKVEENTPSVDAIEE